MFPSTRATASVAGFVAGGSGGVGSISWGGLRDFGNVIRLRVLTMEETPRTLELTGADLHKAVHAYGTNGVIVEVEMPLAPRYDWVDVILGFADFERASAYAAALGARGRHPQEARHDGRCAGAARLFPAPSRADPGGRQRRDRDDRAARARRLPCLHECLEDAKCCSTPAARRRRR